MEEIRGMAALTDASIWIPFATGTRKPHEVRLPRYLDRQHDPFARHDAEQWCAANCAMRHYFTPYAVYFESEDDAVLFRLTWG